MTIRETDQLDGLATMEDGTLILLLIDDLGWEDETAHLDMLQKKINAYAHFVASKQYEKILKDANVDKFEIRFSFSEQPTDTCLKFLQIACDQLNEEIEISFDVRVTEEPEEAAE